jgi:uncharacterized protein (UPF0248 family)
LIHTQRSTRDEKTVSGREIIATAAPFFTTIEASIRYHRIFRIEFRGRDLLDRKR